MLGRGVLRRKATVLTAVILCLLLTIGQNIVEIPRGEAQADVLRVGATTTADLDALDPHIRTGREIAIMENFMEPLVAYDGETTNFRPMLAQNWNVSPDGTVWTFRLRRNVKFHDGTVFKADAVQYALDRINGIKQSPAYPLLQNKVKSFKVLDDYTVQFTVNKGGASVLDLMTMVLMVSRPPGRLMITPISRRPTSAATRSALARTSWTHGIKGARWSLRSSPTTGGDGSPISILR